MAAGTVVVAAAGMAVGAAGMVAAGTVADGAEARASMAARAFTSVVRAIMVVTAAASCGVWFRPLGVRAGGLSTAAIEIRDKINQRHPGCLGSRVFSFGVFLPHPAKFIQTLLNCHLIDGRLKRILGDRLDPMSRMRRTSNEDDVMGDRNNDGSQIDHITSSSICRAIGERLQTNLGPEGPMPASLQRLIDELHRQEKHGKS
jgi:hypothetical protein